MALTRHRKIRKISYRRLGNRRRAAWILNDWRRGDRRSPESSSIIARHSGTNHRNGQCLLDTKFAAGPLAPQAVNISQNVRRQLAETEEQSSVTKATTAKQPSRRNIGILVAGLASAVAILVAVLNTGPSPSGRILGQPGLTANDTSSATEYFQRLADAGATWTQHKPTNEQQLKKLLAEIIQDCETLIEADHDVLSDVERAWFREKCRTWKGKLETTLANLEAGSATFEQALDATQQTMTKLVDVLKTGPIA